MQLLAGWVDDSDLLGTHCLFVQALDQKTASLAREAAAALTQANAAAVAKGLPSAPLRPGLYDVHAPARVWTELGLGRPPDERPLYVGKAESSLAGRDVTGHPGFTEGGRATSVTGYSTLRRSLAALLHDRCGYRGRPRNPAKPGRFCKPTWRDERDP